MKRKSEDSIFRNDNFIDLDVVVSSTECTGLIQTPPLSAAEAESYTEIYNIPQPKVQPPNQKKS